MTPERRPLPSALVVWAVLLWLHAVAMAVMVGVGGSDDGNRLLVRLGPSAAEVCAAALALAGMIAIPGLTRWVGVRAPRLGRFGAPLVFVYAAVIVFFYTLSWRLHVLFGVYLDATALTMIFHNPVLLIEHAIQVLGGGSVLVSLLAIPAAAGILLVGLRCANRLPERLRGAVAASALALVIGASVLVAVLGIQQGGPFTRIQSDVTLMLRHGGLRSARFDPAEVTLRPIESMAEYLAKVDRARMKRFNVILIELESMRKDVLPIYGGADLVMPTVQRIAEEGLVFEDAYAQASHSSYQDLVPLCGQYPLRSWRPYFYPKNPDYPRVLIYDVLHALGWATGIVSSQNENWGNMANFLATSGLDHFLHAENYSGTLVQGEDGIDPDAGKRGGIQLDFNGSMLKSSRSGKIDDADTIRSAIAWVAQVPREQPFFLYVNLQSSHAPYWVPPSYPRRFSKDQFAPDGTPLVSSVSNLRPEMLRARYLDSLGYMDEQIGRLVDRLRELGRWDDTVMILGGDTATVFGDRYLGNGASLLQGVVQVPLILRVPFQAPATIAARVQTVDIPPTVLEILGIPAHPIFQGRSMLARRPDDAEPVFLVAQTPLARQYGLVLGGWKLVWDQLTDRRSFYLIQDVGIEPTLSRSQRERMVHLLEVWVAAQLGYYGDRSMQSRYYAPVVITDGRS